MEQSLTRHRRLILLAGLVILGFTLYANTLQGPFLWDDLALIKHNPLIRSWGRVGELFSRDQGAGYGIAYGYYRPLTMVSYMLDHSLWGLQAFGFHLTNILLHVLAALAVCLLTARLSGEPRMGFWVSLLFLIHPVQTETVAYIADRADLLSALFMFGSFLAYLRGRAAVKGIPWYLLAAFSYGCALFSKENALVLPLLLLAYHWSFRSRPHWRFIGSLAGMALLFLAVRSTVLGPGVGVEPFSLLVSLRRVPGFFRALGEYLRILLWPVGLHAEYGTELFSPRNPGVLAGTAFAIAVLAVAWRLRGKAPLISFASLWFLLAFLPASSIYPAGSSYMAERWVYFPSFGFFLIVCSVLLSVYRVFPARAAACLIVPLLCTMTWVQNSYWIDPVVLFSRELGFRPESHRMHNNLGIAYVQRGDYRRAADSFRRAVQINPRHTRASVNAAFSYALLGEFEKAFSVLDEALRQDPEHKAHYDYVAGYIAAMERSRVPAGIEIDTSGGL